MLIEIRGVQFVNKGAELMLRAVLAKIDEFWPGADICLQAGPNTKKHHITSINATRRLNLKKNIIDFNGLTYFIPAFIRKLLTKYGNTVFEADVDVILDASGFSYGDQWSSLILRQVSQDVERFKNKKKPYVFLPQALGPFTREDNKKWAEKAFGCASIVFAREEESYQYILNVTSDANVYQSPDFTNLLTPSLEESLQGFKGHIAVIPNSKMLSKKNSDSLWHKNYIDILVNFIQEFQQQGETVFLLNHEGKADRNICHQINNQLSSPIEIIEPSSALQVKALIGECKLVLCSRFHGCVSALSQMVPCIATSWSHKYEQLFSEYNQKTLIQPDIDNETIARLCSSIDNLKESSKIPLDKKSQYYKELARNMWAEVLTLVQESYISKS